MIGALVAGFPAHVVDRVLARHLPELLRSLSVEQRDQVLAVQRDIRQSAEWWLSVTTAEVGNAAQPEAESGTSSSLIDVKEAAVLLGVKVRQVRNIAQLLEADDRASRVGGVWLLDRAAVEVLAAARRDRKVA